MQPIKLTFNLLPFLGGSVKEANGNILAYII